MSDYNDYRSDIDMWTDMWADAEEQGIHPKPQAPEQPSEFAGDLVDPDPYWDYMDQEAEDQAAEEQLLQETQKTPNPVYPDSVGPDHATTTPVWTAENMLKEIESLKNKLFKVENRMAKLGSADKLEQKAQSMKADGKMMSEIQSLRKRIDKVSSSLGIEDEPSPWVVKED